MPNQKQEVGYCPDCDARITLKSPQLGQQVICRACGAELEVVDLSPLELDWALDEPYDDDDEYEYVDDEEYYDDDEDDDFAYADDDDDDYYEDEDE
jgi:alpha-aminoadipate carrier protein LysW